MTTFYSNCLAKLCCLPINAPKPTTEVSLKKAEANSAAIEDSTYFSDTNISPKSIDSPFPNTRYSLYGTTNTLKTNDQKNKTTYKIPIPGTNGESDSDSDSEFDSEYKFIPPHLSPYASHSS